MLYVIPEHGGLEGAGVADVVCGDDELRVPFLLCRLGNKYTVPRMCRLAKTEAKLHHFVQQWAFPDLDVT